MNSITTLTVMWYLAQPISAAGMTGTKHTYEFMEFVAKSPSVCEQKGKSAVKFFENLPNLKNIAYKCLTITLS